MPELELSLEDELLDDDEDGQRPEDESESESESRWILFLSQLKTWMSSLKDKGGKNDDI